MLLSERILTRTLKDADDKYELVILLPLHFLIGDYPLEIKHPTTGVATFFYNSKDGFLRKGSTTGERLPPSSSRGAVARSVPLNPILVNLSAEARLSYVRNLIPERKEELQFHPEADLILQGVANLHDAVLWEPGLPSIPLGSPKPVSSGAEAIQGDVGAAMKLVGGDFFCAYRVPLLSHRGGSFFRSRSNIPGGP